MTRKMILNEWTGTHHVRDDCRGLMDSKAPTKLIEVDWSAMGETKCCRFCVPQPDDETAPRGAGRAHARRGQPTRR